MRLLVTRPQPQADTWVAHLQHAGVAACALPLIGIGPPADPGAVSALWQSLSTHRLLMFVSPAAVEWFFRLQPEGAQWPSHCLVATPGPGTAQALLQAGRLSGLRETHLRAPPADAGQFDSEHLWPVLAHEDWAGQRVAIVGGGDNQTVKGRTWLTEQLRQRGALVASVLAYERGPGTWTPAEVACAHTALSQPASHLWLFSSSQAIEHLIAHHLPTWSIPVPDWGAHQALVTHPKIAEQARLVGFGTVQEVRPTLDAVVQARRPGT